MRLTVTVSDDIAAEARRLADDTDRSISAVVAQALADHVAAARRRRASERIAALIGTGDGSHDADDHLREMRAASERPASDLSTPEGAPE